MYRIAIKTLIDWKNRMSGKPLIIRGARQVGKSYLVREFGRKEFKNILEINLENNKDVLLFFDKSKVIDVINLLSVHFNCPVVPGETLLFFDEIQAAPEILSKLRYFYEQIPELHVIAAGSLLEFVLEEHTFSMPVGRIEYMYLGPMSFSEFLIATGNQPLYDYLNSFDISTELPIPVHSKCMDLFRKYLLIGGMPECVAAFAQSGSFLDVDRIKHSIIITYRDDFVKYVTRMKHSIIHDVFTTLPTLPGTIVKYAGISRNYRPEQVSQALHLLSLARVCSFVYHTSGDGVPLGATVNNKKFKMLYLDVGLLSSGCGLTIQSFEKEIDVTLINNGSITEQFIGQHLLYRRAPYLEPELHFWMREKYPSNAEIDFIISINTDVIGIEVKSGAGGSLKSLNQFIVEKKYKKAVRFNCDRPSICQSKGKMPGGEQYDFTLLSLPCYMVEQMERVV